MIIYDAANTNIIYRESELSEKYMPKKMEINENL
jgi:hypothetical protein